MEKIYAAIAKAHTFRCARVYANRHANHFVCACLASVDKDME